MSTREERERIECTEYKDSLCIKPTTIHQAPPDFNANKNLELDDDCVLVPWNPLDKWNECSGKVRANYLQYTLRREW